MKRRVDDSVNDHPAHRSGAVVDADLSLAIFREEMCRDLDAAGFAKTAGIPMDMSRIFANP